jgi:hypothetical protein
MPQLPEQEQLTSVVAFTAEKTVSRLAPSGMSGRPCTTSASCWCAFVSSTATDRSESTATFLSYKDTMISQAEDLYGW